MRKLRHRGLRQCPGSHRLQERTGIERQQELKGPPVLPHSEEAREGRASVAVAVSQHLPPGAVCRQHTGRVGAFILHCNYFLPVCLLSLETIYPYVCIHSP